MLVMRTFTIKKGKVLNESARQFAEAGIAFQVDVFMLDAPPEAFHKNVVQGATAAIHADGDPFPFQNTGERLTGKLRPLITVK